MTPKKSVGMKHNKDVRSEQNYLSNISIRSSLKHQACDLMGYSPGGQILEHHNSPLLDVERARCQNSFYTGWRRCQNSNNFGWRSSNSHHFGWRTLQNFQHFGWRGHQLFSAHEWRVDNVHNMTSVYLYLWCMWYMYYYISSFIELRTLYSLYKLFPLIHKTIR